MNLSILHDNDTIAAPGQFAVMGGHDQRDAFIGDQFEQQFKNLDTRVVIQRAGRFIGEQNAWMIHQRATKGGALAFAAGKLLDALVQPVRQAGAFGKLGEPARAPQTASRWRPRSG